MTLFKLQVGLVKIDLIIGGLTAIIQKKKKGFWHKEKAILSNLTHHFTTHPTSMLLFFRTQLNTIHLFIIFSLFFCLSIFFFSLSLTHNHHCTTITTTKPISVSNTNPHMNIHNQNPIKHNPQPKPKI